jgi:hypothetical protein
MTLALQLREYIQACFTAIWIESHEHADALAEIAQLCREQDPPWRLATWNIETGLEIAGQQARDDGAGLDPLAAIRSLGALASEDGTAILVLQNFHRLLNSAEVVQTLLRQILQGKQNRTFIVVLSPVVNIPFELEKLFVVLEHELPSREQLLSIAQGVATENDELPTGTDLDRVLDAAVGLTRYEAENAYSLSLVRHSRIEPEPLWGMKSQMLKKSGQLQLYRSDQDFTGLGGLGSLKTSCKRSLLQPSRDTPHKRPRGVLLLGISGTGKSAFAKALGKETGRVTLTLDIGSLMGSLVGQSEANIRQALKIAEAMVPCILFADEVEKSLSGVGSSGDSGVSARLFGTLLTWMNDHESQVYLVATCNDISRLPPEFSRAERFDGIFFLDLPSQEERQAIWQLYLQQFELDTRQRLPSDEGWTGAEIRACCRLAALLDLPLVQAAQNVVPVSVTAGESVEKLRSWASGRCLSANQAGIYRKAGPASSTRRRVSRGSSDASLN